MDMTNLMLSMLFGSIGMGFLMYGKKASAMVPVGAGLALVICPYFIASTGIMLVVCLALTALPFVLRGG